MNHRVAPDVKIKRMKDAAKQKAMESPSAHFTPEELDFLKMTYPDLFARVMFAHKDV